MSPSAAHRDRCAVDFDSLTFSDITRDFGRRRALNRVSLTCRAGEVLALLGPNGAGKSTLLSIAASLLAPSAGEVRYGTFTSQSAGAALRARIGLLGHDLYLYPELSAEENLLFFGRLYHLNGVGEAVARALQRASLSGREHEPVAGFSRGMRQRLAIERALLHDPRLALLDEPFTGLDDASTAALQRRLSDLRTSGCIVLLTTHDLELADQVMDRAVVLRHGRLIELRRQEGTLREQYRRAMATS
jgi:heme exporter protein A